MHRFVQRFAMAGLPMLTPSSSSAAFSLVELLFAVALFAILAAMAVPTMRGAVDGVRARSAARYLASRTSLTRTLAVARGVNVGLRWLETTRGLSVATYADGDGDGVRADDIGDGTDPMVDPPITLDDLFPDLMIVFWGGTDAPEAPVVGRARTWAFSPTSTASSGTVYIHATDGTQWAVRLFGVTGRTRVLRYQPAGRHWVSAE